MTAEEFLTHPIVQWTAHAVMCAGAVQFFRTCFMSALNGVRRDLQATRFLRERDAILESAASLYKAGTPPKELGVISFTAALNVIIMGFSIKEASYSSICLAQDVAKFLEAFPRSAAFKYAESRCAVHMRKWL